MFYRIFGPLCILSSLEYKLVSTIPLQQCDYEQYNASTKVLCKDLLLLILVYVLKNIAVISILYRSLTVFY